MTQNDTDLETTLQLLEKAGSMMSKLQKSLGQTFQISEQFAQNMDMFIVQLTNLFTSICVVLNNRRSACFDDQSTLLRSIVKCVPYLISTTWKLLDCFTICKICSSIRENARKQFLVNKLSATRARLIQSAMEFVVQFYHSSFASIDFKFKLVQDNVDRSEFIVRLDDRIKLEDEFDKFVADRICTDFQRVAMKRALETAYEVKRNAIKDTLARQRMLDFIGHPKERVIADQLQDLAELMPDLSKQQLHLCLRHFGYDFEQTLSNLCERDKLPFDLKLILRVSDSFDDVPCFEQKMLPIADDGSISADGEANEAADDPFSPLVGDTLYGVFNSDKLEKSMRFLENIDDEVEVDGKVLIRQQFREKEGGQTEEEANKLKAASLRFVQQMEEADEAGESDSEAEAALQDAKFAAQVGHSGRFNRPSDVLSAAMDPYEDEYDDTFEHALLYSQVDGGATIAGEKEAMVPSKHLTLHSQNSTKIGRTSNREGQPQISTKTGAISSREKTNVRQEPNSSSSAREVTRKQSSSTYTGGRERQIKERNKGKERQRGADKKAKKSQI